MPTVEERLAALETKLAALTETTPTTYYEHQYSGEEIDNAVARALPNGAIDQAVGTFVRPNLLDNWYFGNPVDQKKGKIIQSGVNIYTDSTLKTLIGPAAYACPVVELTSTYAKVQDAKNTSSYYYAAPGDVVRGYTGAFVYTIDRWQISDGSISLSVAADGIVLKGGNNANTDYTYTRVERLPVGKYTFSVLFADNTANVVLTTKLTDISAIQAVESREASGVLALTWDQPEEFKSDNAYFRIHAPGSVKILAAKLEIGPTQTLAHREGDRWVLNEEPEYGGQLRRCQRYHYRLKADSSYMRFGITQPYTDTSAGVFVQLMSTMRTKPVVSYGGNFALFDGSRFCPVTLAQDTTSAYNTVLKANGTGLPGSSAQLLANADTNAYIDFSADL